MSTTKNKHYNGPVVDRLARSYDELGTQTRSPLPRARGLAGRWWWDGLGLKAERLKRKGDNSMGNKVDAAVVTVGFLMLENLQNASSRLGGNAVLPETMIPDTYDPALIEFQDIFRTRRNEDFVPPDGFRQMCIDNVTRYLEERGHMQ
jgi:hypothetical protein